MTYEKLFEQFCKHRLYVDNYSEHTILAYRLAWKYWTRLLGTAEINPQLWECKHSPEAFLLPSLIL